MAGVLASRRSGAFVRTACLVVLGASFVGACGSTGGERTRGAVASESRADVLHPQGGVALVVSGTGHRRLPAGQHLLPALGEGRDGAAIVVRGAHDLVLELDGVEIRGARAGTDLDALTGIGLLLVDCERVTVRGARLGGYKTCVAAFGCRDLVLEGLSFDSWYGMRLLSTPQAEDQADWLWPHENDHDEWIGRYGAAVALTHCSGARVSGCRGRHGQNGILLTRSQDCRIHDDDFSFLSGWGLALYRSSQNRVSHCVFDYCVRGYSHGVYWRGQDSAGILVFERSCDNLFVENSATHGGDGVFLFGGNDVVKGRATSAGGGDPGGSDRNVFHHNDLSFAVANAFEGTFSSDNWLIENRLDGSHQHGVWGGYSTRLVCLWNEILGTRGGGVSIEHGVDCAIVGNRIQDSDVGLELWWDEDEDLVHGPFGKLHDTSSRGHLVRENRFEGNAKDFEISGTSDVAFRENVFASQGPPVSRTGVVIASSNEAAQQDPRALIGGADERLPTGRMRDVSVRTYPDPEPEWLQRARAWQPPSLPGSLWAHAAPRREPEGLETIVMGEWGPWDFRSGEPRPKAREFGGALGTARWDAAWFRWRTEGEGALDVDPRKDVEAWRALAHSALHRAQVGNFTDPWARSEAARRATGAGFFGLVATTRIEVAEGSYRLRVTSDDGVRVKIDGRTVLENWTWHGPTKDEVTLALQAGPHDVELEYFQIDGAWGLAVELTPLADARPQ